MTVNAVVGRIQPPLLEPSAVPVRKGAGVSGLEVNVPVEEVAGLAGPELGGVGDGFFVEGVVVVNGLGVGGFGVFTSSC